MHRQFADGEGSVMPCVAVWCAPLAGLVPLRFGVVGRAGAALLLGRPTVPAIYAHRVCERSGQQHAPVARTRVIRFISLCEEEVKKVGQWGEAPNLGACSYPTSSFNRGSAGTEPGALNAVVVYSPTLPRRSYGVTHILAGGVKFGLLPGNSTCKK